MRGKLNYRQIWLEALRKGEVRLDFDSLEEAHRKRQGFYTSIRPFRKAGRGNAELERAAAEVTLFVIEETSTIVLQHYKVALGRVALNIPEVVSPEPLAAAEAAMTAEEAERISAMALSALEKINGKATPYYNRGKEELVIKYLTFKELYKLPYPLFEVKEEELAILKFLLATYDKREQGTYQGLCMRVEEADQFSRQARNSLEQKIMQPIQTLYLEGYFREKLLRTLVWPGEKEKTRHLLRHIWLRKLINHNRKQTP